MNLLRGLQPLRQVGWARPAVDVAQAVRQLLGRLAMPASFSLRPPAHGRLCSSFHGLTASFRPASITAHSRQRCVEVQGSDLSIDGTAVLGPTAGRCPRSRPLCAAALRKCDLTGQKANNGWSVSFSHHRTHKLQGVNLQQKRIYWPQKQRWVQLKVSAKARPPASSADVTESCV